jgi:deoxyribose-phosphate aldolase
MNIAPYIDHTILKPTTTLPEVERVCREAMQYGFAAVCIPPPYIKTARQLLQNTSVKVATVIGFPFGYSAIESKVAEVVLAVTDGADELDMVINLIAVKNKEWNYLEKEIATVMPVILHNQKVIKVIIESGILTEEEIIRCCEMYSRHRVNFVKTSTGYAEKGATLEAVRLMKKVLPPSVRIKAAGGIRNYEMARAFIEGGASRLGCSSSVTIIEQSKAVSA